MKKFLAILLATVMMLSLAACSEGDAEIQVDADKQGVSEQQKKPEPQEPEQGESVGESGRSMEEALKVWENIWNGDMSGYVEMAPEELWEQNEKTYGDEYEGWLEDCQTSLKEGVDQSMQLNGKITLEIKNREQLSEEDVAMIAEAVANMYELDAEKVKAAYKMDVEASYEKAEKESGEMYAMQYGEDWYLIMYTVYEKGECNVNFYI